MKFHTLLLLGAPLASAWSIKLFDKESYIDKIHDRSGTLGQSCYNLPASASDKAQSMKWDRGGPLSGLYCRVKLYDKKNCAELPLGDSDYSNWNIPAFSSAAKNKVSSYDIDCR